MIFNSLARHYRTVWLLALQHVRERYIGTAGGALWAVLHPVLLLLVFWVVFAEGFKVQGTGGQPFLLQLFCALIAWMAFSEAVTGATQSITGRAYLIRKIAFPSELLPLTHLVSALFSHTVTLVILALMLVWYRHAPGWGVLLFPYYLLCLCSLAAALSLLLSAANVFYRDIAQGLTVFMNMWFWITPIVWPREMLPARFAWVIDFNPLAYIVSGYQQAFLSPSLALPPGMTTLYFWVFTLAVGWAAVRLFENVKPGFADVL